MQKYEAEDFLPLVNNVEYFKLVQEYAEYRINLLQKSLETLVEINDILRVQGQIKELRRFQNLRVEVQQPTDRIVKIKDRNFIF
jgi:hypothetical protein